MAGERVEIPLVIGGKEVRTGETRPVGDAARPRARAGRLAQGAAPKTSQQAIAAAPRGAARSGPAGPGKTAPRCSSRPPSCWRRRWRDTLNAATMLGQTKTVFQAEIDAACELIDFWRFNVAFAAGAATPSSRSATTAMWNQIDYRAARRLRLRRVAVQLHGDRRQPADRAGADGQHGDLEAGVERDAERLLHDAAARGRRAAAGRHQLRAGRPGDDLRRRCSTRRIWPASTSPAAPRSSSACGRRSARTSARTASYPRLVGETGGKDFIVAHPSADPQALAVAIVRGGVRVPGPEVLGRQPRLRAAVAVAGRARSRDRDDARTSRWATSATSATSWAR